MGEELREVVALAIHQGIEKHPSVVHFPFTDKHEWHGEWERMKTVADAAIDTATPIVRKQMLLELIGKAKETSGTICMWDGEGRDSFLTVAEWLNIYLAIEDED